MTTIAVTLHEPIIEEKIESARSVLRWWTALAVITVTALLIRIVGIDRHSFWYDEAVTAELIRAPWLDLLLGRARDNGNPPLFWLLAKFWSTFFGDSEIAMRSMSVVFSLAAVPLLAALAYRLFDHDRVVALVAAALLAISPISLELANEARTYALIQLLTIVSTLFFIRWIDRQRGPDLLIYCATIVAACLSHYYAMFLPLAHGASLMVTREGRRLIVPWFEAMVITAIAGMFWFSAFWSQLRTPDNLSRMGSRWPLQFFATPLVLAAGRTLVWRDTGKLLLAAATFAAVLFFWLPALIGLIRIRRQRHIASLLIAMLLLPIATPLLAALLGTPMYHVRAGSIVLPAAILLLARGLMSLRLNGRVIASIGIVGMSALSIANYMRHPLKDDWRAAAPRLLEHLRSREAIVFDTSIEVTSFGYYARRHGLDESVDVLGVTQPPDAATGSIVGVRFESLKQAERQPREYGSGVFDQPRVSVAICVPHGSIELYKDLFGQRGYRLVLQEHFHRIDLLHFARLNSDVAPQR